MDWNDLRFFLAIARTGSLAGAARRLGVNHSTAFRRLNAFEQRLGVRLFERMPNGYVPSAAGEKLIPRAERVESEFDGLGRELMGLDERLSGVVRLTTAPNLAYRYVAAYLAAFRERYPDVVVELAVSTENRDLSRREADVALRATSRPPGHLVGRKAIEFPWYVCAGETWLERNEPPAGMDGLAGHPFVGGDESLLRLAAVDWVRRHVEPACVVARGGDLDAIAAMVVAGLGLAPLPQDQDLPGLVKLFPMEPEIRTQLWLLTHPDLRAVPRVRALTDFIAARLRADTRLAPAR